MLLWKMLKFGMPLEAVQHKMKADNAPSKIQEVINSEMGGGGGKPPSFVSALPSSPISTFTATSVGDNDKLSEEEEKIAK